MKHSRRGFISTVNTYSFGALLFGSMLSFTTDKNHQNKKASYLKLKDIKGRLAIAMWDYSWLLKHHKYGAFENWDKVLDELVERGYNAIRIDAFPQLVAKSNEGVVVEKFFCEKKDLIPVPWGADYSIYIEPRQALKEFIPKCEARGIYIGLSSWFMPHVKNWNAQFKNEDDLYRVWAETIEFLEKENLLNNVVYIDILNEFPLWHGFNALKDELLKIDNDENKVVENPDANNMDFKEMRVYSKEQIKHYQVFLSGTILKLSARWQLDYFASSSFNSLVPWEDSLVPECNALDLHIWLIHNPAFMESTNYINVLHQWQNDRDYEKTYQSIKDYFAIHKSEVVNWMESQIAHAAHIAAEKNIVAGNTEGWGLIRSFDHPLLDWDFIKEAGSICVDLAIKYNYKFICTSNFTHPQFKGIWDDIDWHRKLTKKIKG